MLARPYFADGPPGPIEASLATVPELLDVAVPFFAAVLGPGATSGRLKEIVIVRTSALQGCRYCVDAHSVVAIDTGLSVAEVLAPAGRPAGGGHLRRPGRAGGAGVGGPSGRLDRCRR